MPATIAGIALFLSCFGTPAIAHAKTLAEYDADIEAQSAIVAEKEKANQEAQAILAETAKWYYQNASPEALLQVVIDGDDLGETLSSAEYVSQIYESYAAKAAAAKQAKAEAIEAQEALEALRAEKAARAKSLENAKQVQFPQGGNNAWSGLPYWTGSVARAGCGLCSYTVAINVLTGNDYTPADMLDIRGDWKGMDGYPDDKTGAHGQTHYEYTKETFDIETYNISHSVDELREEMSNNEACAIICAAGSAFKNNSGVWRYSSGHFICVVGYDENGFHVSDSAYSEAEGTDVVYSDSEMSRMLSHASHVTIYHN